VGSQPRCCRASAASQAEAARGGNGSWVELGSDCVCASEAGVTFSTALERRAGVAGAWGADGRKAGRAKQNTEEQLSSVND